MKKTKKETKKEREPRPRLETKYAMLWATFVGSAISGLLADPESGPYVVDAAARTADELLQEYIVRFESSPNDREIGDEATEEVEDDAEAGS